MLIMTLTELEKGKRIHFVGIGGVSMSGLAEIALNMGYKITGSDQNDSDNVKKLIKNNIDVVIGHNAQNVVGADLVVYTAAVKKDNPEYQNAIHLNIPIMERSEFLGELTKIYDETIGICGTHGKTTTTSMMSLAFLSAGKDPTIQVGADYLKEIGGNYKIGNSPYFIIEACEYVESFLKFHPETVTLLNIEEDHLDYYKDLEHIKSAFKKFVNLVPERGFVISNADDFDCLDVVKDLKCKVITFGIKNTTADWIATDIKLNETGYYSYIATNGYEKLEINLSVVGFHNIYNSLSVIATAHAHNLDLNLVKEGLEKFTGASRRFEYRGTLNGAKVYDDYAHHPTEIMATIKSAASLPHNKIWVVFQPHTYTRTAALFNEFSNTFANANNVILTDIYAAREIDDGTVSSKQLSDAINEVSGNCQYISSFEEIVEYLKQHVVETDIVLTIGAGSVTKISHMLTE
ncbi:MAG: UDP-N-acetylmuramate--L-alanine ligase [Clostridia bacterium]|nr:UDP-N-acetylmuramate--L-alanine ligase [Clostridia bacterium]